MYALLLLRTARGHDMVCTRSVWYDPVVVENPLISPEVIPSF